MSENSPSTAIKTETSQRGLPQGTSSGPRPKRWALTVLIFSIGLFLPLSYVSAVAISSSHKYAWSDNVGYINFGDVTVSDSALGGYAWSANKGFINFSPAQGGVLNDGTGNLSGSAWGEQLGWIDFGNVSIDSNGQFSGTATGTLIGTITFNCTFCDVRTAAASPTPTPTPTPGGGGGSQGSGPTDPTITLIPPPVGLPTTGQTPSRGPVQETAQSARAKIIDILKDGILDIIDFNAMMVNWDSTKCSNSADMNDDCNVDIFDFNTLMVYWGVRYQLL